MLMSKILFKKMSRIFDGMFDDVIEGREREGEEYNIQVIDVEEDRYLLLICFYEFDETFFVFYDIEEEQAYIVGFEEDEDRPNADSELVLELSKELLELELSNELLELESILEELLDSSEVLLEKSLYGNVSNTVNTSPLFVYLSPS